MISKCWYLVYTKRDGKCHSFYIFKKISRGMQLKGQNTTQHAKELWRGGGQSQREEPRNMGCLSGASETWWQMVVPTYCCTSLPPDRRKDHSTPARCLVPWLASSTAPQKLVGRRVLQGLTRRILTGGNAWNAVQEGIWINVCSRLASGCALTAGKLLGALGSAADTVIPQPNPVPT